MTDQQDEIAKLTAELQILKDAVRYLAYCKQTADEYLFFDWVVKNEIFGEKRTRLDHTLLILGARLAGEEFTKQPEIPGIPTELLYSEQPPTYEEATALLMAALEVEAKSIVDDLLKALRQQGMHKSLVALVPERPT